MSRAQHDMALAFRHITDVAEKFPNEDAKERKIYGSLCHSFPIMVRTCGLCQALAFSMDKAAPSVGKPDPRNKAHAMLLSHVAELLNTGTPEELLEHVRNDSVPDYMLYTRRVLVAWIYWKRFAVSILKVESARSSDGDVS